MIMLGTSQDRYKNLAEDYAPYMETIQAKNEFISFLGDSIDSTKFGRF